MCAITEIADRAKEFCAGLLTNGFITDEQYPSVYTQVKEQMALCTTAMMAEVRLRTGPLVNERMAVDQITRECMSFIGAQQEDRRRKRRKAVEAFRQVERMVTEAMQPQQPNVMVMQSGGRTFAVRFPEFDPSTAFQRSWEKNGRFCH